MKKRSASPSWDALYAIAEAQQGSFTREQAQDAGFSDQLLQKHLKAGAIERLQRGIYRLTRFPASSREQEDLVVAWLWSSSAGVFSHETALRLHGLSDALPARIHLTLPAEWEARRLTPPSGVHPYFADVEPTERAFIGSVPVTTAARSVNDVAEAHGDMAVVDAAIRQGIQRGFFDPADVWPAVRYLATSKVGAWRVRPESVPDLDGRWLSEFVSGFCRRAPAPDWRLEAEAFAGSVGGQLRAAAFFRASSTMTIEIIWPESAPSVRPSSRELRAAAVRQFGWTE